MLVVLAHDFALAQRGQRSCSLSHPHVALLPLHSFLKPCFQGLRAPSLVRPSALRNPCLSIVGALDCLCCGQRIDRAIRSRWAKGCSVDCIWRPATSLRCLVQGYRESFHRTHFLPRLPGPMSRHQARPNRVVAPRTGDLLPTTPPSPESWDPKRRCAPAGCPSLPCADSVPFM